MRCFIKTEKFTRKTLNLSNNERKLFIAQHKEWIMELNLSGINAISGYLVDENFVPGGGGLMVIHMNSFEEALKLIKEDPMIKNNLVTWEVNEWIALDDNNLVKFIEGNLT